MDTVAPFQTDQEAVSNTDDYTSLQTTPVTDSFGCSPSPFPISIANIILVARHSWTTHT